MTDQDTFCRQIRLHEKAMYSLAYSVVKNEADAADVIGEAIYRAYKNIDSLKDINSFKPWILRIVHNTAIELIRKNTKTVSIDEVYTASDTDEREFITAMSLREAVENLGQPYRTVVVLYYYEDIPIARIAKITGATTAAVKKRLSRAREQLRKVLKEDFANE